MCVLIAVLQEIVEHQPGHAMLFFSHRAIRNGVIGAIELFTDEV